MGNKISRAANDCLDRDPALPRPESGNQEALDEAAQRKQFTRLKLAIPSPNFSPSSAPLSSTSSSSSKTLRQQSTDTDGASSPKVDESDMVLPGPFQVTDVQYLPLCAVSRSEPSTITKAILDVTNIPRPSPPVSRQTSVLSSSRPPSSLSWDQRSSSQLSSSGSLVRRPHPLFPTQSDLNLRVPAPPLQAIHFACYHAHKRMLCSRNIHHPLPCMACGVEDQKVRWRCVWCCLRICTDCMDCLNKDSGRNLAVLLKDINRKAQQGQRCHRNNSVAGSGSLLEEASTDIESLASRG